MCERSKPLNIAKLGLLPNLTGPAMISGQTDFLQLQAQRLFQIYLHLESR